MRRLSLNARTALDAGATDEIYVVLLRFTHPSLDKPVFLSTDPTQRLSIEPLMYGTYSSWLNPDREPFLFILASTMVPDDKEDTPAAATVILETVDKDMATVLRSIKDRATVDMAVVLASSTDVIEAEWTGLRLMNANGNASEITLQISRESIFEEPFPAGRMTRARFPGLHM
ncbi:hypothetical protein [Brucella pituitosa]|uniref:hypothetical protein n=1 Tax=Brucella pituitosa TaxID=571256 RepID=UPI003F4AB623